MLHSQKLPGYRFPGAVIGYAVWLYHRFTVSHRDVEERLLERGIVVTRESMRTWCIKSRSAAVVRVLAMFLSFAS